MKGKAQQLSNKARGLVSLLLVCAFMWITLVQAFHKHNYTSVKDTDDTEYVYSGEKCDVCDYVLTKQSHHSHMAYVPVMIAPVTKPVTLLSHSIAGTYKITLQGYTNKGPPAASC